MRQEEPKMDALRETARYTYEDLAAFPDDGLRREIIDGELYVSPSPALPHQVVIGNLYFLIRSHLVSHPAGRIVLAPFDVVFSKFDVVEPDLLFVSHARDEVLTTKYVDGSPDLVVEVLSSSSRRTDEITKRRLYERFDVLEYWIIDSEVETVKVYRRVVSGVPFEHIGEYAADRGECLRSPLFGDLTLPLASVFEDLPPR
jgi:Uma2 family endonuclease